MKRPLIYLAVAFFLLGWTTTPDPKHPGRNWHNIRLNEFADFTKSRGEPHVCTSGVVKVVRKERDGDWHIILGMNVPGGMPESKVILEIMPEIPLPRPQVGWFIEACGLIRYDGKHRWYELHPLLTWRRLT